MAQLLKNTFVRKRNGLDFSRSIFPYEKRHSTNLIAGAIVPVHNQFLYPGMTPNYNFGAVIESAPLISTSLDNVYIDIITIWSPCRLVMTDWNEFLGESHTVAFTINRNITIPKVNTVYDELSLRNAEGDTIAPFYRTTRAYWAEHALAGHLGFKWHGWNNVGTFQPTAISSESIFYKGISVLPSRIYENNWNYFFRNENIQAPILIDKTSVLGTHDLTYQYGLGPIRFANKLKDYFVTATPAPSLMDVSIAMDQFLAPVGIVPTANGTGTHPTTYPGISGSYTQGVFKQATGNSSGGVSGISGVGYVTDLSALTVNRMYYALMEQRFANKMMKGRRATEFYKNMFGIESSEAGHDEPTLISQKRYLLNISQVITTSNSTDIQGNDQPVGSKGAFSVTGINGTLIKNFVATEHGYLQTYAIIRAQQSYASGIERHLAYDGLLDTYLPDFDHIGQFGIDFLEIGEGNVSGLVNFGFTNAWSTERGHVVSDVVGIMEPTEALAYKTFAVDYSGGVSVVVSNSFIQFNPKIVDRMFLFPVCGLGTPLSTFTSTVTGATCGYDANGEPMDSNRYQFLIQFAVKGTLTAVMSADSEPLQLRL